MGDVVPLPLRKPPVETERPVRRSTEPAPLERQHVEPRPVERRPVEHQPVEHQPVEPLWRESVGRELRRERLATGRRLVDVAEEAGVSPQYLSEVERGLKDPSSELLAAMVGALGLSVTEIATRVAAATFSRGTPLALAA
jgi:hypothetical protein